MTKPIAVGDDLKSEIRDLIAKQRSSEQLINQLSKKMDVAGDLGSIVDRVSDLSARLQGALSRQTVATEMARYFAIYRKPVAFELMRRLIALYDKPDEWWVANGTKEIGQWEEFLCTGDWGDPMFRHTNEAA